MQSYNLVAIYDTQARAQAARSSLIESGLDSSDVRISTSSAADETSRGTRKEELLLSKEELNRVWVLRKVLSPLSSVETMELLLDKMGKTKNNAEFLSVMQKMS